LVVGHLVYDNQKKVLKIKDHRATGHAGFNKQRFIPAFLFSSAIVETMLRENSE
jgi:hypothetical protein